MAYNLTPLYNATTGSDLFNFANTSTDGALFGMFMFAIYFVLLMALKKWDFKDAWIASNFACFMLSMILFYAEMLSFYVVLAFLILLGGSMMLKIFDKT